MHVSSWVNKTILGAETFPRAKLGLLTVGSLWTGEDPISIWTCESFICLGFCLLQKTKVNLSSEKHQHVGDLSKTEGGSPRDLSDFFLEFPIQVSGVG